MPPKSPKSKKGKDSEKSKKPKKEDVEIPIPVKLEVEEFVPILSGPDISPYERVIGNAEMVVKSLLNEEKHIIANQVTKLIDYCHLLKDEVKEKQKEFDELQPKVDEANKRTTQALNVSIKSERAVQALQEELENAWREIDASRLREQSFQEQMSEMYGKMTNLEGKVKKSSKSDTMGETADAGPLANKKETILRERDRLQAEVEELEKRLHMQRLYSENVEKLRLEAESANQALMQELESSDTNKTKFKRTIQDLYMNLEKTKEENLMLTKKISTLETRAEDAQKQMEAKATELQVVRLQYEKVKMEQSSWNKSLMKRSAALNICTQDNHSLAEQLRGTMSKLKAKEFELVEIKADCKKSIANYDMLAGRLAKMGNMRNNLGKDMMMLKNEIHNLQKECIQNMKTIDAERKEKDTVIHERDNLRSTIAKLNNMKKDLEHSLMLRGNTIERLQDDIMKRALKFDEMKQSVDQAMRERDRSAQEIEVLHNKIDDLQESVTLKSEQVNSLKTRMVEKQSQHIKLKQNLEATNSERLILRQQLQVCTEEKDRTKSLLTHVSYQVSQLKEEITNHQNQILTLTLDIEKLAKEKQELKMEIRNQTSLLNKARLELKDTKKENDHLYKSLSNDERRLMKQAIKLDNTVHEKDLIGSQMIRRNNEIVLLREQISILEIALQRGQMQYNHRIEDIKLLKQELMRMRSQRNILTRGLANTADMRQEVLQLNRMLIQERVTNSALKEEVISPMNIHRWRPLAGRDPERMDLIKKIIVLQKRMLRMQSQASKREKDLKQSHRLYMLLKEYIEKLPSYKVKVDLLESQRILRVRSRKLKALTAELSTKDVEIKTRDCAIAELQTCLNHSKKAIGQLKRKQIVKDDSQRNAPDFVCGKVKTLGAGFKVHCV